MKHCPGSLFAVVCVLASSSAFATFHTFQIAELYSNADGTIQYVVLHESQGIDGQNMLTGRTLASTGATGARTYVFPHDLPGGSPGGYYNDPTPSPTAGKKVLIATQGFAALGLVAPDYVIPNGFLVTSGGTVNYAGVDQITYTGLPIDGGNALYRDGNAAPNVATNFAGASAVTGPPAGSVQNFQGLWWNAPGASEDGWGINFAHQGDTIFASWFTYDASGRGWWLVMTALKTATNTYTGTLYQTHGPAFNAVPFAPKFVATAVGTGTLSFSDSSNGTFAYTVNGISQTKTITRQVFGPLPTCTYGTQPNLNAATNYQDLWWNAPAASEDGWGINFTHQGDTIFATWFTYDLDGTPLWLVVTALKTGPGTYAGTLYRTTGPAFNAVPFAPKFVATAVGTATLSFADGNHASFAYTITGIGPTTVTQSKQITRQMFTAPGTACQ